MTLNLHWQGYGPSKFAAAYAASRSNHPLIRRMAQQSLAEGLKIS